VTAASGNPTGDPPLDTVLEGKGFMSELKKRFETASAEVKKLKKDPGSEKKLQLYALYKQATEGDAKGARPGLMDFVGGAKHDAWAGLKGTPPEDAMKRYVALVEKLQQHG
jgi:diazepam-binding inhibitor (GABA receptor modulator, acyl-CoA-binding protein)